MSTLSSKQAIDTPIVLYNGNCDRENSDIIDKLVLKICHDTESSPDL